MAQSQPLATPSAETRPPTLEDGVTGLRVVFRILDELGVDAETGRALLGGISRGQYYRWRRHPERAPITWDLLERLSYILGIYKAVQILVPDARQQVAFFWRENAHPVCNGRAPMEVMRQGRVADLYTMRRWLDGERGW